ncbi:MAG TPA: serine hydrolase domain-containing protein [Candidatus Dormibacteraeota bacterium]|nr:serine hydrolase domain-containing protein [Candidatus Dormibacteraeota bacterium]
MVSGIMRVMIAALLSATVVSTDGSKQETNSIENKIDGIFSTVTENSSPGVAVLVRKNGQTLFQRGYGVRELQKRVAIDAWTNFRLASCTKQFTAMAVMLLVHDGKLRYDERLTDVFPDFPKYGQLITIRNLLNHTSGLADYEELMDLASSGKPSSWTEARQIQDGEVLGLLETQKSGKFTPGTQWSYSNSGYVVLGLVAAKVSEKPFADFLSERIFQPLKMNHTLAYIKGTNEVQNRAYGHSKESGEFNETDQSTTSATLGDGGVYSNLEDLALWDDALARHTLLSAAEMQPALTPVKLADGSQPHWASGPGDSDPQPGKLVSYGFGWFLNAHQGNARMWHYGDTVGFKTVIERFTKKKLTVIVLCNRSDLNPEVLASKVADLYLTR